MPSAQNHSPRQDNRVLSYENGFGHGQIDVLVVLWLHAGLAVLLRTLHIFRKKSQSRSTSMLSKNRRAVPNGPVAASVFWKRGTGCASARTTDRFPGAFLATISFIFSGGFGPMSAPSVPRAQACRSIPGTAGPAGKAPKTIDTHTHTDLKNTEHGVCAILTLPSRAKTPLAYQSMIDGALIGVSGE